jgi:hypothetical protein
MKKVKIGKRQNKMGGFAYADIEKSDYSYMNSLIEDINAGKQILLINKKKVIFDKTKIKPFIKLIEQRKGKIVADNLKKKRLDYFVSKKTKESFFLTHIEKTVYSKGGGSGAGAYITKMSEMGVCVCLAARIHSKGKCYNSNKSVLVKEISGVCDLGSGNTATEIENVMDWLNKNPNWLESCKKTAVTIINKAKITTAHHFHRDSKFMNSIYATFRKNIKETIKAGAPGLKINANKWNPSDIWISNKSQISAKIDSVTGLNAMLIKAFRESDIVGVSLKKVGTSASWKAYNLPGQKSVKFEFSGIVKQTDPWSAKDVYFLAGSEKEPLKIQLRSFDNTQNIQAEIKGKTANNGKCGHGPMSFILKKNFSSFNFKSSNDILALQTKHGTDYVLEEILTMWSKVFGKKYDIETYRDNLNKNYTKDKINDYMTSKYQAMQVAVAINKNEKDKDKLTRVMTALFGYAHSIGLQDLFESSVYGKVS